MENNAKLWNAQITLIPKNQDDQTCRGDRWHKSVVKPTKVNPF